MGHQIEYADYGEKVNKKSVQAEWDDFVRRECWQEGASGLANQIRWIDKTLPNYEAAVDYLNGVIRGSYDQVAVKYNEYPNTKETKKETLLKEKATEAYSKYRTLSEEFHFKDSKSAFIGCKKCNSKLSLSYLHGNTCPLCKSDLRPTTTILAIEKAKNNWEKLRKDYNEEHKKNELKSKPTVKWVVRIEYHV